MIYCDTDVLINFAVIQDKDKHKQSQKLVLDAVKNKEICISFLVLQEFLFVMERLNVDKDVTEKNYSIFKKLPILEINSTIFYRGYEIANMIGFKSINDSLHTALAERNCQKLITYNKDDFKKIQKISTTVIEIL